MTPNNSKVQEYINFYIEQGISIIPLEPEVGSKKPSIKWKERTEKKTTHEEIVEWRKQTDRFAIVCGEVSSNLVVIDVDKEELFAGLNLGVVAANTYTEERQGKFHIYLRTTKPIKHKTLKFEDGEDISIRFNDNLIMAGGIAHPSGGAYQHFPTSPREIATVDTGLFDDLEKLWRDYRGLSTEGKKTFAELKKGITLKTNIADAIKGYAELKELKDNGDTYTCRCPLPKHKDLTPSFTIYKKTNSYYCWGCNRGGNIINFVKDFFGISKKEAIARLKEEKVIEEGETEFDILEELENAIDDAKKPKYYGTINFDPEHGIFFTVPIDIPSAPNTNNNDHPPPQCKPIFCNPREAFAQDIEGGEKSENIVEALAQEQQVNKGFAQFLMPIEGVPLYLIANQRVQILQAYLTLLKTGETTCKYTREEIGTHLPTKHMSYFKLSNDIEHYIISCWAIGTYLFPMFPVYPYLINIGEKGTNKSGMLEFLSRICWNATAKLSLPNEAPLFRLMHQAKPTQIIDEVHRQLNDPLRGPVLQALLEMGHEQGGCVPRCDENDRDKINFYNVYCPKALASREGLELEEKGITIVIHKDFSKEYAIARKNLESDPDLDIIAREIFNFAIAEWAAVYDIYQNIEPTPKLSGRYFMLWAPILAICKIAYPDRYGEMVMYAEEAVVGVQHKSYEVEIMVLSWLVTRIEDIKADGNAVYFKAIRESLNLKWQSVHSAIRNLGLIKADRDTKQGKKYYLHVDRIEKLAKERNISTEETFEDEDNDEVSEEEIKERIDELGRNEIKKIKKLEKEMLGVCDICKNPHKPLIYGIEGKHGDIKKGFCDACMGKIRHGGAQ